MAYTRYFVASELARDREVLELGCGAGIGLGMLARNAKSIIGGDLDASLLAKARREYAEQPLVRLTVQRLPFGNHSFDVVLFLEGSYYVDDISEAVLEIRRVLRDGGVALFVNANPDRPDFIESPSATRYLSGRDFKKLLGPLGFSTSIEGAFRVQRTGLAHRLKIGVRKVLKRLGLVPTTLRGRVRLKRLAGAKLVPLPTRLYPDFAAVEPRFPLADGNSSEFKVIYVTAKLMSSSPPTG